MNRTFILLAFCVALQNISVAQEQIGLHFDNYAASSGMLLNPAATFASPNPWELNIVSAGLFAENNYVYLDHQSVLSALHAFSKSTIPDPQLIFSQPGKIKAYSLGFIQGPSAFIKFNHFTFGIFADTRSAVSVLSSNFPFTLALDSIAYGQLYQVPAFKATMMNWSELGFNIGTKLRGSDNTALRGAINVKFLGGWDGMYFLNNESFDYSKLLHEQLVNLNHFNSSYAYTSNFGSNTFSLPNTFNGKGVGADVGFIYTAGEKSPGNYVWKFGVSVVDIGRIHFIQNAGTYSIVSNTDLSANISDLQQITSLNEFNATGSKIVYGATNSSQTGNQFTIGLPTALTLQAERSIGQRFFVGAVAVRRVVLSETSIYRPNMVALIPRYESKWISAAIPVELFDYNDVHAGASLRFGPLTIGSDNILSWVMKGKLEGSDIYAGLRVFPFWSSKKNNSKKPKENIKSYHSKNIGSKVICPKF
ncbi:MAG TPA: DUF5723 family protein [Chitinophagales bacterium]|nr:DUF5723 family protein [Chitinophagales bacterium]